MWLTGFSLLFYCFIVLNKTIYFYAPVISKNDVILTFSLCCSRMGILHHNVLHCSQQEFF